MSETVQTGAGMAAGGSVADASAGGAAGGAALAPHKAELSAIVVRGARVHNLKNISFEIPHNAITVVTGVSGSGKSSLAFDTIYAEGQRRYIESLSAYARQFLERIEKPDVDEIDGIAPAIAIRQKNTTRNPRSTVATATEIYDYLRLLYARAGRTHCTRCGSEVRRDSIDEVAQRVLALEPGRRFYVLFRAGMDGIRPSQEEPAASPESAERPGRPQNEPGKDSSPPHANRGTPRNDDAAVARIAGAPASAAKRRARKGAAAKPGGDAVRRALTDLQRRGFQRIYQNGRMHEFSSPETLLDVDFAQPVYAVVDRLAAGPEIRSRLADSVEIAYREGGGEAILEFPGEAGAAAQRMVFSERFECKKCGIAYQEPEPRLFSFNNPFGACPRCQGFGNTIDFGMDLVIPDPSLSINQGVIEPWTKPRYRGMWTLLKQFARNEGIPLDKPFRDLTEAQRKAILEGDSPGAPAGVFRPGAGRYPGVNGFFAWLERKKYKLHVRVFLSRYRGYATCPECGGTRLRPEARAVRVAGKSITETCAMTVTKAREFFGSLKLGAEQAAIAGKILEEVRQRLRFLEEVGLDYITLDRLTSTLSGGEAQRIQLATSLGSQLVGALYVLDEPSIGLHPRDTHRLVTILKSLRDLGNTILVVEHDPETIAAADYVLDLGPGAGELGGKLLFAGPREMLLADADAGAAMEPGHLSTEKKRDSSSLRTGSAAPRNDEMGALGRLPVRGSAAESLTAKYLNGELRIPVPQRRRKPSRQFLRVFGARAHNLKNIDVQIPLGLMVAITGVSGSGKSTLVYDVLYKALEMTRRELTAGGAKPAGENGEKKDSSPLRKGTEPLRNDEPGMGAGEPQTALKALCDRIEGDSYLSEVVLVDQSPIGRTPRSNPATYLKAFDAIRDVFAGVPEAKRRGYAPGHFSFNIPGGRCEACQGEGTVTVEMQFLADVELVCEECHGTRFKAGTLEIRFRDKNVHEVLGLTVHEAMAFFTGVPKVQARLKVLEEVGLGYLRLGQSATTLSGGEAQRLKLAARLVHAASPGVLYIFDEPTTGLHFDDIQKLLASFRKLLDRGASILVIEHNLDVIKSCDWVIDLGPEGGVNGGQIVATGTPEQVARNARSHTAKYLQAALKAAHA